MSSHPAVAAIRNGDVEVLRGLLEADPKLANSRPDGQRTLLHVATDWPGRLPNGPAMVNLLLDYGADVNARFEGGRHRETPLHWAASNDDVAVLDVLLDRGADIEADGAVIGGSTALADAVAFAQWSAARRLVERGAVANLWEAAALGLRDHVAALCSMDPSPSREEITKAFWCACHGGQRDTAEYLLERGADRNWVGYDHLTPLGAAQRHGNPELVRWLECL